MARFVVLAFAAVSASIAGGCAPAMTVSSHVQRDLDFSRYRTFDWGPADALPTGDPRLDDNPDFKDRFEGAIERQMALKGYQRAASQTPDLLLHYHASVHERLNINQVDTTRGYCYDEDCQGLVFEYEQGTIVLDVVDARANRVIWRGWAQDALVDLLDDRGRMERRLNEAASRMLARLPSRPQG